MMTEKFFYIEPEMARTLLMQIKNTEAEKHGVEHKVYLIDEYAVLSSDNIKIRNVVTRDDDLAYFDELIKTLMELSKKGAAVVPVLGYCYYEDSADGMGYIFQKRAKGEELYDDEIMNRFYACGQDTADESIDNKHAKYIISRTSYISKIPQKHYDKFVEDMITLMENDILIDFMGKSNFFYDEAEGFQFIDINSHTDYKYGLTDRKADSKLICAYNGFVPCHIASGSKVYANLALDERALLQLSKEDIQRLSEDNKTVFEKCRTAMLNNGVSEEQLQCAFEVLKIFGV